MKKIVLFIVVMLAFACSKKDQNAVNNPVQSIPVNQTIYPNDPLYFNVQAIGGWMYVNGGLNGIVLYRKSQEEFIAVERTSSQLPNNANARVSVMSDNFTLLDTVSKSKWRIFDGSVITSGTSWPLRLYGTTFDGNVLLIRN